MNEIIKTALPIICKDWAARLTGEETTERMLELFISEPQFQEFCFENDYPSLEMLREIADVAEQFNVIIDRKSHLLNPAFAAIFGNSEVSIECSGYSVCCIVARHDSIVTVSSCDHAIVDVQLYDNAQVIWREVNDGTRTIVTRHNKS